MYIVSSAVQLIFHVLLLIFKDIGLDFVALKLEFSMGLFANWQIPLGWGGMHMQVVGLALFTVYKQDNQLGLAFGLWKSVVGFDALFELFFSQWLCIPSFFKYFLC